MKRILLAFWAALALLTAPTFGQVVTTDVTKTGVAVATPIGSGTFAQMKTLTCSASVNNAAAYHVTNYGRGGSIWRCAGSLGDWFPTAPLKVYEQTTLITGLTQTAAQVLLAIPVEADLLTGKTFRVLLTSAKNGATDTLTPVLRMGNAGTTADAAVVNYSTLAGASRAGGNETWLRMASATSVERLGGLIGAVWAGATSIPAFTAVTVATVAAANFLTVTCTMSGTTDTAQLGYVAIEIQP